MSVTIADVRAQLDREEPKYEEAARLGPEALPYLEELVKGPDVMLASKAAYLASLIKGDRSLHILEVAASHPDPIVRVAVASGLRNLTEHDAGVVLDKLTSDHDQGVRKVAVKSVSGFRSPAMIAKVQRVAEKDPELFIREIASTSIVRMKSAPIR
jgi:HEAT repeat protein